MGKINKNRIREIREKTGMTLQQVADLVGTDRSQVNRLERGERRLTTEWLERLAGAFGCTPADLLAQSSPLRPIEDSLRQALRGFIFDALEKTDMTIEDLASATGIIASKLNALVHTHDTKTTLTDKELWKIAEVADIPPLDPIISESDNWMGHAAAAQTTSPIPSPPKGAKDLPIYGKPANDRGQIHLDFVKPIGYGKRPFNLFGIADGYAVFVNGQNMAPRYHHGELVHVDPSRDAKEGDYVIVKAKAQTASIKRVTKLSNAHVVVEEYAPPSQQTLLWTNIDFIHVIVGTISYG